LMCLGSLSLHPDSSMRRAIRFSLSLLPAALLAVYAGWTQWQPQSHYLSDLRSSVTLNYGTPGPRGNLLGIQPELFSTDYQSSQHLYLKLAAYLEKLVMKACSMRAAS